jgi:hypothetical protein
MHQLAPQPLVARGDVVTPASVIRDLGVWIDNGMTMSSHVTKSAAGYFAVLRQLRGVRRLLSREFTSLVVALALSRLDCYNAVLAGLPESQLDRL